MGEIQGEWDQVIAAGYDAVYRYAFFLTGDRHQAADLAQETVVKTLGRLRRHGSIEAPEAYMIRVVLHEFLRTRSRTARVRRAEQQTTVQDSSQVRAESPRELLEALDALTPRERAAVVCRYYLDLSERDAAAAMSCTTGTVKQLTSRALKKLRATTGTSAGPNRADVSDHVSSHR